MPRGGRVVTLQKPGRSYRVTIPVKIINELGWNEGDDLWFEAHHNHIEIYPVEVRPKSVDHPLRSEQ